MQHPVLALGGLKWCAALLAVAAITGCQTTTTTYASNPDGPPPPLPIQKVHEIPDTGDVLFALDSAVLSEEADAGLRGVVVWMMKHPGETVTVAGHGCDLGGTKYNYTLGLKRAETVQAALIDKGIAASRITVASRGETAPIVPNTSGQRARNRRVAFELHPMN